MSEKVFNIEGMSCNHCVMAVKDAVEGVEGVSSCDVDLGQGTARVVYAEETAENSIVEAIEEEGFKVK